MQHDARDSTDYQARREELGRQLRALREASGLSTQALAQATRISQTFLDALERGAFERLPGQVFGRGFLRGICKHMGADVQEGELLAAYDACWATPLKAPSVLKVQIKNKPSPDASEFWQAVGRSGRRFATPQTAGVLIVMAALIAAVVYAVQTAPTWQPKLAKLTTREGAKNAVASIGARNADPTAGADAAKTPEVVVAPSQVAVETPQAQPLPGLGESDVVNDAATFESQEPTGDVGSKDANRGAATEVNPSGRAAAVPPQAVVVSATAVGTGDQTLELEVTTPVKVRLVRDGAPAEVKELAAQTYKFAFKEQADVMVYDAAAVNISYNGRPLGPLGNKGRVRRLSFQAEPPVDKKL